MNRILIAAILLSVTAVGQQPVPQQPCPSGYHHEKDSAACWPDVSRQQSLVNVQQKTPAGAEHPSIPAQDAPLQPSKTQVPAKSESSLIVFRERHFTGSALKPSVYIDGREVARLQNGTYYATHVEPGKHNLTSSAKHEPPLLVEIKPGETTYVQMIVVTGTWRGAGRLIPAPEEDGKAAVSKLRILELK